MAENCTLKKEYCYTSYHDFKMEVDQVLCEHSKKIVCDQTDVENVEEKLLCTFSSVAFCIQRPKLVTVTMKKQPCSIGGEDFRERITQVCITDNANGNWSCQHLLDSLSGVVCLDINVTKGLFYKSSVLTKEKKKILGWPSIGKS